MNIYVHTELNNNFRSGYIVCKLQQYSFNYNKKLPLIQFIIAIWWI